MSSNPPIKISPKEVKLVLGTLPNLSVPICRFNFAISKGVKGLLKSAAALIVSFTRSWVTLLYSDECFFKSSIIAFL